MSIDKYVMRGFTSSVGTSDGRWVATPTNPQALSSTRATNDSGSSFVMGGGLLTQGGYRKPGGFKEGQVVPRLVDDGYDFNVNSVMRHGARDRRQIPSNCIGGSKGGSGDTFDSQKTITFVFFVGVALLCALVAIASPGASKNARPKVKGAHAEDTVVRPHGRQPVWYR